MARTYFVNLHDGSVPFSDHIPDLVIPCRETALEEQRREHVPAPQHRIDDRQQAAHNLHDLPHEVVHVARARRVRLPRVRMRVPDEGGDGGDLAGHVTDDKGDKDKEGGWHEDEALEEGPLGCWVVREERPCWELPACIEISQRCTTMYDVCIEGSERTYRRRDQGLEL